MVVSFALPEVMGSILQFATRGGGRLFRIYVTGDTLVVDDLKDIPKRLQEIDLALLHLGSTYAFRVGSGRGSFVTDL